MCWTQQSCCFSFYSHKQASTSEIYYYYYHHRRDEYRAVPNPGRTVVVIFGILQRKSGHSQRTEALHQYTNIARSPLAVRIRVGADCGESVAIERKEFYMWSVVFFSKWRAFNYSSIVVVIRIRDTHGKPVCDAARPKTQAAPPSQMSRGHLGDTRNPNN